MTISGNQFRLTTVATLSTLVASLPLADKPCVQIRAPKLTLERWSAVTLAGNPAISLEPSDAKNTLVGTESRSVTSAEVANSLKAQKAYLLSLPANWDGYGAKRVSGVLLDQLENAVTYAVGLTDCRAPDIIPGGDGSVQAEWHRKDLELSFSVGPTGSHYFAVTSPDADLEFFDEDALPAFRSWAHRLAKKAAISPLAA